MFSRIRTLVYLTVKDLLTYLSMSCSLKVLKQILLHIKQINILCNRNFNRITLSSFHKGVKEWEEKFNYR